MDKTNWKEQALLLARRLKESEAKVTTLGFDLVRIREDANAAGYDLRNKIRIKNALLERCLEPITKLGARPIVLMERYTYQDIEKSIKSSLQETKLTVRQLGRVVDGPHEPDTVPIICDLLNGGNEQ